MKRKLLLAGFVIVGLVVCGMLLMDAMHFIDMTNTEFILLTTFGIVYAFVYSELVFGGNGNDNGKGHI